LTETELVEPVGDLLHRGSASDYRASGCVAHSDGQR
jgi:hypothetical protein